VKAPWELALERELAKRPRNDEGQPLCECGAVVGERKHVCDECMRKWEEQRKREDAQRALEAWRERVRLRIGAFPQWNHTRIDSPEFVESIKSPKFRKAAQLYQVEHGDLALLGHTGTGKTSTMDAIAQRAVANVLAAGPRDCVSIPDHQLIDGDCYFIRAAELIRAMRRHPLGAKNDAPEFERALRCRWLVVDDLGLEPPGTESTLHELYDERYKLRGRGLVSVTMFTSGFTQKQLCERYGPAFVRRITEPKGAILEAWGSPVNG
jgi:DNA replication protein DnaC